MIILLLYHLKYHIRICIQYWKQILLWCWYFRRMTIDCRLKSLLKNYLETVIVGSWQADVFIGVEDTRFVNIIVIIVFSYITLKVKSVSMIIKNYNILLMLLGKKSISVFFAECKICVSLKDWMIKWLSREKVSSQKVLNQKSSVEHKKMAQILFFWPIFPCTQKTMHQVYLCSMYLLTKGLVNSDWPLHFSNLILVSEIWNPTLVLHTTHSAGIFSEEAMTVF